MTNPLHLSEYIAREKKILDEFEKYYISQNKDQPDQWPLLMSVRNWDEQFFFYTNPRKVEQTYIPNTEFNE